MKTVGIVAEYNPFHNGHQYHLNKSKELTESEGVVCVMSSSFLQRGKPGLLDKWSRTKMALAGGADLVIELPMPYAIRSAEFFAYGAVRLLDATGVVNHISFGSEAGILEKLDEIAGILANEPGEFDHLIGKYIGNGLSYPGARTKALKDYIVNNNKDYSITDEEIVSLTSNPNNILGIEYLKAIHRLDSDLKPITIPRLKVGYHDTDLTGKIASATAIRKALWKRYQAEEQLLDDQLLNTLPQTSQQILKSTLADGKGPVFMEHFCKQILTLIRRARTEDIKKLFDVRGGLENRIKEAAGKATSINQLIKYIKTKRYTWTRIQRIIFHFLLNLNSLECEYFDQLGGPQYIRVLGFNLRGRHILAEMKEKSQLPIITTVSSYYNDSNASEPVRRMLDLEVQATNLYSLAMPNPKFQTSYQDITEKVIIWK